MHVIARQILLSLAYTAQFSYPLSADKIVLRFIQPTTMQRVPTKAEILLALEWLEKNEFVERSGDFFFLPGMQQSISIRKRRASATQKKLKEILPIIRLAKLLPWVNGLAITGSAAVGNADVEDDTDLLVVAARNRLWLVRPIFIFCAFLYGKRRSWQKEEKNSWCFNLWLEDTALVQPPSSRSLYTAYEVCQANWLVSKHTCQEVFFTQNQWVRNYLPWYFADKLKRFDRGERNSHSGGFFGLDWFFSVCNDISYTAQLWYMKPHMTREKVAKNFAFFHPRDTRKNVVTGIKKMLQNKPIVVLVTGVFDLLHQEHLTFLQKSKAVGDRLIVGVESDLRVKKLKGPDRPIQNQDMRIAQLKKLSFVDDVFLLPEEFSKPDHHRALLKKIQPDILAVSSSSPYLEAKERLMQEIGGKVLVVHDHNPAVSTTLLIEQRKKDSDTTVQ